MKNSIKIIFALIAIIIIVLCVILARNKFIKNESEVAAINDTGDFTIDLLKRVNNENNYLISPYSIEVALNMLRTGADGDTKKELNEVLPIRESKVSNEMVKIANALFIKNEYKNVIESSFKNRLKSEYNSEVLYDEFETPKVINEWVKKSTNNMIEKVINDISPDFVLGLANAIAIDATWLKEFECNNTTSETFIKSNNKKINVEMMHNSYNSAIKYLNEKDKGIIIPYKEGLEFIALLPDKNLKAFINELTREELDNLLNSFKEIESSKRVNLSLPRFSYDYSLDEFKNILIDMGIKKMFESEHADFSKMITKENLMKLGKDNLYVSDAVHKTYIDLNEKGTKAAAVTFFGVYASGAFIDEETIDIEFNKPFIYMIRDEKTKELLFIGSVYEPNLWKGSTCKIEK